MRRILSHFAKGGKLSMHTLEEAVLHEMPGSSQLEREVYEQYVIDKYGKDALININNPMGGRRELYASMVNSVIEKYGLPK